MTREWTAAWGWVLFIALAALGVVCVRMSLGSWRHVLELRREWPLSRITDEELAAVRRYGPWPPTYPDPDRWLTLTEPEYLAMPARRRARADAARTELNSEARCRAYARRARDAGDVRASFGELLLVIGGAATGAALPPFFEQRGAILAVAGLPVSRTADLALALSLMVATVGVGLKVWRAPQWSAVARVFELRAAELQARGAMTKPPVGCQQGREQKE